MSTHDGPGIRSTIFFKGCNFRCAWCHNPETWIREPQRQFIASKCIGCHACAKASTGGAIRVEEGGLAFYGSSSDDYKEGANACTSGALSITGRVVEPRALVDEICRDKPFFDESGGGVTISGGEPLFQEDFLKSLLIECRSRGIHTALETNLSYPESMIEQLLPYVDIWMVDLKSANEAKHREHVKHSNRATIQGLEFLSHKTSKIIVRTPVIPGFNDSDADIIEICEIVSKLNIESYELLAFHTLGFDKFTQYNTTNPMMGAQPLSLERFEELKQIVREYNINK